MVIEKYYVYSQCPSFEEDESMKKVPKEEIGQGWSRTNLTLALCWHRSGILKIKCFQPLGVMVCTITPVD